MKIAVASGKGGTGKTTISTSLAYVLAETGKNVRYMDCDVEEPNGHLFLKPVLKNSTPVHVPVPQVDNELCSGCGLCGQICQYSAIVCIKGRVMTFPELCHGCGGCKVVCPQNAISEQGREVGVCESGTSGKLEFIHGNLRIGEAMSPPLIRKVRVAQTDADIDIIDAPPGTSCPVITTINGVDFVLLVTEPTPFGLNDLALAIDMVRELGIAYAVVVNRHEEGNNSAREFCAERNVEIVGEISDNRKVAEVYSRGGIPADELPEFKEVFGALWNNIKQMIDSRNRESA